MKIHPKSVWSEKEILDYFNQAEIPIRIACTDTDGCPIVCSLWFIYQDGYLWSASHKSAYIIKVLGKNNKIGFEIATNQYPYKGVRGKADVELISDSSGLILGQLIDRYLKGSNEKLSNWLMSRAKDEYAIKIKPSIINSWDFSHRMEK